MTYLAPRKELIIFCLLDEHSPLCGTDMATRSNGNLKLGTAHVILLRMEKQGYVSSWKEQKTKGPRRFYTMTEQGRELYNETLEMYRELLFGD